MDDTNNIALIDNINTIGLVTDEDFLALKEMGGELAETFEKAQCFRTKTEMEVSVLNDLKFPTPSAKYWQSVREQNIMFTELVRLSYEYRRNLIEVEIKKRDIELETDDLKRQLLEIDLEEKMFARMQQEKIAKSRIEELRGWSEIKEREAAQMSEEDLANVDNPQLIGYTKRWIKQSMVMGENGSPAERQNLLGQLRSGIMSCIKKGVLERVLEGFSIEVQTQIKQEYGLLPI